MYASTVSNLSGLVRNGTRLSHAVRRLCQRVHYLSINVKLLAACYDPVNNGIALFLRQLRPFFTKMWLATAD